MTRPTSGRPLTVRNSSELETFRDCPRCGSRPANVYHYRQINRSTRVGYCSLCQSTYAAQPRRLPKPKPATPIRHLSWSDPVKVAAFLSDEYMPPRRDPGRAARTLILERDDYRCRIEWYGEQCNEWADTVDHIRPWAQGGDNRASNLRAACGPCNFRKGGIDQLLAQAGAYEIPELTDLQVAIVAQLDSIQLRAELGSRKVKQILRRQGLPGHSWQDLGAATQYRRERGALWA